MTEKEQALKPENMPIYHYWQGWYLSFYSSRFYVDVAKRWRGLGIIYLLLLICIASIPLSIRMNISFNHFFNDEIVKPLEKLPSIYIQNGKVSFDKPMPYFIKNEKGNVISIIDTTGKVTNITNAYPHLSILITKDKVAYRLPKPQFFSNSSVTEFEKESIYVQTLSEDMNEVFDGKKWVTSSGILRVKLISSLLIYPMILALFFALYLILLLIVALLGQLIAQLFFSVKLHYPQACRLLTVATTPQILILFAILTADFVLPGLGFFLTALLAVYFCYGVVSLKRDSQKLVSG